MSLFRFNGPESLRRKGVPQRLIDIIDRAWKDGMIPTYPDIDLTFVAKPYSHGTTWWPSYIRFYHGTEWHDTQVVLLHELAHVRAPKGEKHGDTFYRAFYEMVDWYRRTGGRLVMRMVLEREGRYRAQAIKTAKALGIRGAGPAAKVAAAHRKLVNARPPRGYCPVPAGQCGFNRRPRHTHYLGRLFVDGVEYVVTEPVRPPWQKEAVV